MDAALAHVEILGPRLGLDRWLEVVQAHGGCHVADALAGHEAEPAIGRPALREEERRAAEARAPALRALQSLSGVLPPAAAPERGVWSLPPGGVDEPALAERVERARLLALNLRAALERVRAARTAVDRQETLCAAGRAAADAGLSGLPARAWRLPVDSAGLARRLRIAGLRWTEGRFGEALALVAVGPPGLDPGVFLEGLGGEPCDLPADLVGLAPSAALAALEARALVCVDEERQAQQALAERLRSEGHEARRALDGLEDAEARLAAWRRLADTGYVVALRAYVPRERLDDLAGRLEREAGLPLVVRRLAAGSDAPGPVLSAPSSPLDALAALSPARLGERPACGPLAVLLALAGALLAGDVAVGLMLLAGGALLGSGAAPRAPRREAGLLAQGAGLLSLWAGLFSGRALGALGARLLGEGWGLGDWLPASPGARAQALAQVAAAGGLALAFYGVVVTLARRARRTHVGVAQATGHLRAAGLTGLLAWSLASESAAPAAAALLYGLALSAVVTPGERQRLLGDLLGWVAAFAVALVVVLAVPWALARLDGPAGLLWMVVVALLAWLLVLESARMAMGFTYDVLLRGTGPAPAFEAFASVSRGGPGGAA